MKCEHCDSKHQGEYGSGRFCSSKCARSYSTSLNRDVINEKTRTTILINHYGGANLEEALFNKRTYELKRADIRKANRVRKIPDNILAISKRTTSKILKRMGLPCSCCGWYVDGVALDIHHIIPRSDGGTDEHTNLTYLCPNCHRLVHSGIIKPETLVNLQDYIGDGWREYYYVK